MISAPRHRKLVCTTLALVGLTTGTACGVVGSLPVDDEGVVLVVAAAISMSDALDLAVVEYERTSDVSVVVNAAGSDTLATQLIAGAPGDVFLSADTHQMDRVESAGLVTPEGPVILFTNELAAVVSRDRSFSVTRADDLMSPDVGRIALGDPASVPAGVYARQYLRSSGLWESLFDKFVPTRNVRAALAAVEAGHVDVAFVYRTDAATSASVDVAFTVPLGTGPTIRYVGAALVADHPEEARRFLKFLVGPGGRAFEASGFLRVAAVARDVVGGS